MRKSNRSRRPFSRLLGRDDITNLLRRETDFFIQPILNPKVQIGPSSVDLRLDSYFLEIKHTGSDVVRPEERKDPWLYTSLVEIDPARGNYTLQPGKFLIGQTFEYIRLPPNIYGILDGRSSLGRLGVVVHSTASSVDPGWEGHLTLELRNSGEMGVKMIPLMRVARLILFQNSNRASYSDQPESERKYFRQTQPTPSKIYEDKDLQDLMARRRKREADEENELKNLLS
jgi:dCTP deaminase